MASGTYVSFATGRMPRSAEPFAAELGVNAPSVHFNGAVVWDWDRGRVVWERSLPPTDALRALEVAETLGVHVNLYVGSEIYIAAESSVSEASASKEKQWNG